MDPINTTTTSSSKKIVISVAIVLVAVLGFLYLTGKLSPKESSEGPSQEERREVVRNIVEKAQPVKVITVSGCKPSPEVAEFKMGSEIEFKNGDSEVHAIFFSPAHSYRIPAKGKMTVKFDFWEFPGVRKYTCDGAPAGSVVITK